MDRKTASIYTAGLLQGIALVAFPAASTIFTNPDAYHFTSTQYGSLFIPQSFLSILAAALNSELCKIFGIKRTFAIGLCANFFSMALLTLSAVAMSNHTLAYFMLILATSCLGIGFGVVVPTINRVAEELFPLKSDAAVLTLNALLGIGTALAPILIAFFSALGFWWGLPLFLAFALLILILYSLGINLPEKKAASETGYSAGVKFPAFAYIFLVYAFLYGVIETLNGNWISIYMSKHLDASINIQALALTSFWGMVTFGRIFFAVLSKFFSMQTAFQIAPFISTIAFIIIASLTSGQEYWAVITFGLTGLGCSVLLPLLISFGGKQLNDFAASMPGMIISSYLLGYGVAAFGVGPLKDFGNMSLRMMYVIGAIISFILAILSFYIVQRRKINN